MKTEIPSSRNCLIALGLAGVGVRLWLWWISIGSNDATIWAGHAQHVLAGGLAYTYRLTHEGVTQFNHPPLMGLYAAQVWTWSHGSVWEFARWMKLPGLAGEVSSICAIWRFVGLRASVVYAWLPAAILVSSYHGSTDCLCAALVLWAAIAFDKESHFLSGLLWSASLNVKLLPLVLLPLVFLGAPNRKAWLRLACGFALGMLPFLPCVLTAGQAMFQTMIRYNSLADNWGLVALLNRGTESPTLGPTFLALRFWWLAAGRYAILVAVMGVALLSRYRRKLPMTEQAAMGAALFLVLTPGFGVQYVVFALPLLCVADFPEGVRWGWMSGLFIGALYWMFQVSSMPLQSSHYVPFRGPAILLGMMAWAVLVHFLWAHLRAAWQTPQDK